ncbi:hypothetical protein OAR89_02740 [Pelagibacteraceae bacterium]|nr:hypothetical protein [Pelagibacteraceae bacterium]MDC0952662.1 hypothetical protein [Pelagibacteraceae bacterium]
MKTLLKIIASGLLVISISSAKAEVQFGLGLIGGQTSISGSETEGSGAAAESHSKSELKEIFGGGDIFVEHVSDSGLTFGVSYVPLNIELGSGERTDSVHTASDAAENDTGTRQASAELSNLYTVYSNVPLADNGLYALLGAHFTTVETAETLPNSSYGDEDIYGYQLGLGVRSGKIKYEFSYSDFEEISINSSGGGTNKVTADADAISFRVSLGF